ADAVVMQEDTQVDASDPEKIQVTDSAKPWENIRFQGEDVKTGVTLINVGERFNLGRISLLAATGVSSVQVSRRAVVGLLATGSELIEPGRPLPPGKIYESNRTGLSLLVQKSG